METSAAGGKKLLYVGGLAEEVDAKVLQAAFIPFGDIVEVKIYFTAFLNFGFLVDFPSHRLASTGKTSF